MDFKKRMTYFRALTIPFRVTPLENVISLLFRLLYLAIAPITVLVTAYFLDTALAVVTGGYETVQMIRPLIFMGALSIYNYITGPVLDLLGNRQNIKSMLTLRPLIIEKWARLEYKHVEDTKTMDILNRMGGADSELVQIQDTLLRFIFMVGSTISIGVILLVQAPLAGVILVVMAIPVFYIAQRAGKAAYQTRKDTSIDQRYQGALAFALGSREFVAERNLFGWGDYVNDKFYGHFEKARKWRWKIGLIWNVRGQASGFLLGVFASLGLFIMAPAVAAGNLTVGTFIALQVALFSLISWIGWAMPWSFRMFAEQREFLKDFNEFAALSETPMAETTPAIPPPNFETLVFKDVSFTYPGTEKMILKNLSMAIEKGKHYAFVGVNGAGKTTLTKLITRLYDDYSGEIILNGKPLRDWPMGQIKAMFCALFQDFARYDISVAENTAIGKISGAEPHEIDRALDLAGFNFEEADLKQGKDTMLGRTHKDGTDLSGGQWQRLAFARAIINPAPVKILDEPTAALDPVAEGQVYAQFESISRGITTIYISHRLASAKMADTIFVLDDGNIAEQGSHDELMAANGIYAEMYNSQQGWYASEFNEQQSRPSQN